MFQEDLMDEIMRLKKLNCDLRKANELQKVEIRKLQNELFKKNNQIEILTDPKKVPILKADVKCVYNKVNFFQSYNVRKIVSEHGASMLLNLRSENNNMQHLIKVKDANIKQLQTELEIAKLYTNGQKKFIASPNSRDNCQSTGYMSKTTESLSCNVNEDYSKQQYKKLHENIRKINENFRNKYDNTKYS